MADEQQKKSIDDTNNSLTEQDKQTIALDNSLKNPNFDSELSNSSKKQKKIDENTLDSNKDHQDITFNKNNSDYCSFSTTDKKSCESKSNTNKSESNPIEKILNQTTTVTSDLDSEEDEQRKKIAAAKKLLFPNAVATSFSEVVDTLRDERRQEFCPIYKDETPEEISLRQTKQKPVGSLLSKRIRWDDLKRKREEEKKISQIPFRYGPYGPMYANQQQTFNNSYEQYNGKMQTQSQQSFANPYEQYYAAMQNQSQQSFANPYEQYYAAMQNQYQQMVQMARAQQEHNGFWPEYQQQLLLQNNNQIAQNSIQQQSQPYTYPYPAMYSSNMASINTNIQSSYTSNNNNLLLNNFMQPPPPPPNEPYPY